MGIKKIIQVNLSQVGIIIKGQTDVKIGYHYGVLKGTSCRRRDIDRLKALDLDNAASGRLFVDYR